MTRVYSGASWFFGCLTAALLVVAPLLTPERALADGGTYCASQCSMYSGTPYYDVCMQGCLASQAPCGGTVGGANTCNNTCIARLPADCNAAGGCNANPGGANCPCSCKIP